MGATLPSGQKLSAPKTFYFPPGRTKRFRTRTGRISEQKKWLLNSVSEERINHDLTVYSRVTSSLLSFRDLLEWRHSPEGEQFAELADALCNLMEDVQLDAKQRKFIWPDGQRLDLDQSVQHIQKQYPDFRRDWIEEYLIDWIDMDYAPEHYSQAQLDELDRLTARWISDHARRAKTLEEKAENSSLLSINLTQSK